ncbi:GTP-binding protein Rho1 [Serendipita sp. 400]|nr:GTP-binding protein Rho1 [Serendipita sp. 400]
MQSTRRKLVLVGDGGCGKTTLVSAFYSGEFRDEFLPTAFESRVIDLKIDGTPIELDVFDTAGQEDYEQLRLDSYPDSHVVLICFSVEQPESLENIHEQWVPEVLHFCSGVPYLVVGCKTDLRHHPRTLKWMKDLGQRPVTSDEGKAVARRVNAQMYVECSSMMLDGVTAVFEHAARAALSTGQRPKKKGGCLVV